MCQEYVRLLAVYNKALTLYSKTAAAVAATSDLTDEEVRRMIGYGEQAKAAAILAGIELEDHCEEHGCAQFRETASNET